MKISGIIIIILLTGLFCNSFSQKIKPFGKKGVVELGGSVFYSNTTNVNNGITDDDSYGQMVLQPYAGYFIVNNVELGIQPTIDMLFFNGETYTTTGLYFAPSYNISTKSIVYPELKLLLGYTTRSSSNSINGNEKRSGFSWGAEGGVKINILGNSLLFIGLQYREETYNTSNDNARDGYNIITFGAGWKVFF